MKRRGLLLLLLAGLGVAQADDAAKRLREFFRDIELNSGNAVLAHLLRGQDPNQSDPQGQKPLHWALLHESDKALDSLLADPRTDVNGRNGNDETPLMMAALRGRRDWLQLLVKRGAKLESGQGARVWTPLHYACSGPDRGSVEWLIGQGADLDARSPNGSTPLMMAAGYGAIDSAALLLKRGADPKLRNDLGLSAWEFARRAGREDLAGKLGIPADPDSVSAKP